MQTTTINTFGNLTNQPATRTGKNNQAYTIFTLAHNPAEGQREFVKCFAWGNDQKRFAAKLQKGDRVHIIGESTERKTKTGKIVFVKLGYFRKYDRSKQAAA